MMKKIFKKVVATCLSVLMCLIVNIPIYASENTSDIDRMFKKAYMNASNVDTKYATLISPTGEKSIVKMFSYQTEPKYNINGDSQGEKSQTYVVSLEDQYIYPLSSGNQSREEWDETGGIRAYLTIYYTVSHSSGQGDGYLLTRVKGGWERADTSLSLTNKEVLYTCKEGINPDQYEEKYPSGLTFSYSTGFTEPAHEQAFDATCGATSMIDISRSSGKWSLWVTNAVLNEGNMPYPK